MAAGFMIMFDGGTEEQYRAVHSRMRMDEKPPSGLIFHSAGPVDGGWRVIDFRESRGRPTGSWSQGLDRQPKSLATGLQDPARHRRVPGHQRHEAIVALSPIPLVRSALLRGRRSVAARR